MWLLRIYYFVVVGFRDPVRKVVTIGEWRARVSSYPVRGNPALCWQRSGLVLEDVLPEAFSCGNGKFLGLTICWKSKETIRSCTVLVVEPASSGGSYSRHNIMVPMLAKIYILLSKCFLHYALIIISKLI